jgi:hypothetical protein
MSDPRSDFFASGSAEPSALAQDARSDFFASGVPDDPSHFSQAAAPEDTWWNAIKGVGETGLALGSGTLKAVTGAVNDLLPGEEGRKKLAQEIETDPVLNYRSGPEAKPITDALSVVGQPIGNALHTAHEAIAQYTSPRIADVAGDMATIATTYGALGGKGTPAPKSAQQQALEEGQKLGYVVPPSTTNPTVTNQLAEGLAGKLSTAQVASVKNQGITNNLIRKEFNLPADAPLTSDTMDIIRATQGKAYQAVSAIPEIKFGADYEKELDALGATPQKIAAALPKYRSTGAQQVQDLVDSLKPPNGTMDGETAVELSKSLRSEANSYQSAADRMGDPQARMIARAYRGSAEAVENAIEKHLTDIGQPDLAKNWDNARRTIAKTYSVENAMDGAGNVDALKLGKQLIKGKPLSGNLEAAANFANAFPKAARNLKESFPGISPLDVYAGAATEAATGNPLALAIAPARMGARSALLSPAGQALARPGVNPVGSLASSAIRATPGLLSNVVPPVASEEQNGQNQ